MDLSRILPADYKDILAAFAKHRVRYLVIGGYAVIYYTEPRYTRDFDVWVDRSAENARRVYDALVEYGAPMEGNSPEDFVEAYSAFTGPELNFLISTARHGVA